MGNELFKHCRDSNKVQNRKKDKNKPYKRDSSDSESDKSDNEKNN